MEKTTKQPYEAPKLTVVSFKMEKGYAASSGPFSTLMFWENNETNQMEDYEEANTWTSGSNHFWD
jgi:hypothetical protein